MSRLIECLVTEPPTSGEVQARVLANLASGEIELVLNPSEEVEVPRPSPIAVKVHPVSYRRGETDDENLYAEALISGKITDPTSEYSSVVIRLPRDTDQPAGATLVTYQ